MTLQTLQLLWNNDKTDIGFHGLLNLMIASNCTLKILVNQQYGYYIKYYYRCDNKPKGVSLISKT